ncbi:hypothetical protein [Pseudomonas marginalis]|uniref:hypothetical protein n=1 Tax=Pseudomonas marginalis TaxID=298 RepID=UPI0005FB0AA5|nr:hypothetical protein [Pseudomonas marginalis]KJZ52486.1 hypothetical protein VC36_28395 [Pseudomonas marginalis]KJZ57125.1 hypothetical protein VC37_05600 [Pseudomonas marginalis]
MTKGTKSGQFSPVSLEALELIAKREKKDPRLLLAYLGLARHTTMNDLDGRGPNMLTGAGAEKVRVLTGCGTPVATGIVSTLANMGLIKKPAAGLPSNQARWAMQHQGTVNIPHALIDGGIGNADSIGRLLKAGATDEVVVCAIMLLINCYAVHDLEMFGGIDHHRIWRQWDHMINAEGEGVRVTASPKHATANKQFISNIVGSMGGSLDETGNSNVFWKAFNLLEGAGLFYEVVTSISIDGGRTPIRVNDFHAVGADSSLLEAAPGLGVGFYVHKDNDRSEPEGCWFYLPSDPEKLIGIWRLRFRCATPETAKGIALDGSRIDDAIAEMCEKGVLYSA